MDIQNENPQNNSTWKELAYWIIQSLKLNREDIDKLNKEQQNTDKELESIQTFLKAHKVDTHNDRLTKLETSLASTWKTVVVIASLVAGVASLIFTLIQNLQIKK